MSRLIQSDSYNEAFDYARSELGYTDDEADAYANEVLAEVNTAETQTAAAPGEDD